MCMYHITMRYTYIMLIIAAPETSLIDTITAKQLSRIPPARLRACSPSRKSLKKIYLVNKCAQLCPTRALN